MSASLVANGIWLLMGLVVVVLARTYSEKVSLTAWQLAAIVFAAIALGYFVGQRRGNGTLPDEVERELTLGSVYGEHVREILNTLQRAISGDIDGVTVEAFVQKGMLDPARDLLTQGDGEEIRLSVLMPAPEDPLQWAMQVASGHSLEGQQKFRLEIAKSFAGRAYSDAATKISEDVQDDPRFTKHAFARPGREYGSIIAVPLMDGDDCFGVLCTISTFSNAFSRVDKTYVEILGAIIGVALSVRDEDVAESDEIDSLRPGLQAESN